MKGSVSQLFLLLLFLRTGADATFPRISNSSTTVYGDLISTTAWHARTLTSISWDIPAWRQDTSHVVVVIWDQEATETWRFGSNENVSSRADNPPSSVSTSYYDPSLYPDEPIFKDCTFRGDAFDSYSTDAFFTDENRAQVTVDLGDSTTWWYTGSLDQEAPDATSATSGVGNASVLLSEPGFYSVCLLLANETCETVECVNITVFQPTYDFLEVSTQRRQACGAITWLMNRVPISCFVRFFRSQYIMYFECIIVL